MGRISTASTNTGKCLLVALFVVNLYRAATQSFTTDESMTFTRFVDRGISRTWHDYDANNHVLHTLVLRATVRVLGTSEFALRLPGVLAGGLYFIGAWFLMRRLFRSWSLFLAGLAMMCLNPLVLDHLVACRGYGMALAAWLWGLALLGKSIESSDRRYMAAGAFALALCMCANLAFLFPAAATAVVYVGLVLARQGRAALPDLTDRFLLTGIVTCFLILLLPLQYAGTNHFYYGAKTILGSISEATEVSLFRTSPLDDWIRKYVIPWFAWALLILGIGVMWAVARAIRRREVYLLLAGGTAVLALGAIVAAHSLTGMMYPLNRTALYWLPLLPVLALAVIQEIDWKPLTLAAIGFTTLIAVRYISQIDTRSFGEWRHEAGMKSLALRLRDEAGNQPVQICTLHGMPQTLGYYQVRLGMKKWNPVAMEHKAGPCDWSIVWADASLPRGTSPVWRDSRIQLIRGELSPN